MKRVFTLFYDRTISTPSLNSQQYFPYPVTDHWGRRVLPEDLGLFDDLTVEEHLLLTGDIYGLARAETRARRRSRRAPSRSRRGGARCTGS